MTRGPPTHSQTGLSLQVADHAAVTSSRQRGTAGRDAPRHPVGYRVSPQQASPGLWGSSRGPYMPPVGPGQQSQGSRGKYPCNSLRVMKPEKSYKRTRKSQILENSSGKSHFPLGSGCSGRQRLHPTKIILDGGCCKPREPGVGEQGMIAHCLVPGEA